MPRLIPARHRAVPPPRWTARTREEQAVRYVFRGATDIDVTGGRRVPVQPGDAAPCRRCLQDIEPGETAILVSYDPFDADSPYRSASPVFVHERSCRPYLGCAVP